MKMSVEEAYEILGVTKDSSDEDIKASYRRLALQTHPDKNRDDPVAHQKFLKVSEAYRRIIDPQQSDELDEDMMGEEDYDDDDYETMFAFRMFERMFSFGNGVGFRGDRRNTCHCWECRNSKNFFIPKPQTKYIPKSQRPKDPKEEAKKLQQQQNVNPHDDNWLSDEEVKPAPSKAKKAATKKSTTKKKSGKKTADPFSYLKDDKDKEQDNDDKEGADEASSHRREGKAQSHISHPDHKKIEQSSDSDSDDDDDAITAEEMASRMAGAPSVKPKSKPVDSHSTASSHTSAALQPANRVPGMPPSGAKPDSKAKAAPYAAVAASGAPSIAPSLPKQMGKQQPVPAKKGVAVSGKPSSDPNPMLCMPAMPMAGAVKKDKAAPVVVQSAKFKTQVGAMVEMGFNASSALKALENSNGSIEAATNLLLTEGGGPQGFQIKQGSSDAAAEHQPQSLHVSSLRDAKGKPVKFLTVSDVAANRQAKPMVAQKPSPAVGSGSYLQKVAAPPPIATGAGRDAPKVAAAASSVRPEHRGPPGLSNNDSSPTLSSSANQATYGLYDTQIQALAGMGFSSTASLNALEKFNGNLKQAASFLLSQELVTDSVNSQPTASTANFPPPAPISTTSMGGSRWVGQQSPSGLSVPHAPPGLVAPMHSVGIVQSNEPLPRSRGPPISDLTSPDSEFGFDYGPLSDFSSFSADNTSSSGTSRLLGMSKSSDISAPPGLGGSSRAPVVPISPHSSADFSASLMMPPSGSGLLSQQAPPGMDINLSGGVSGASEEPFMMYGFQDSFGSGLDSRLSNGLDGNLASQLGGGLSGGLTSGLNGGLNSGMPNGLSSGLGGALGGDLMGSLGGHSSSDLSSTASPFSRSRGPPDSNVAPSLPPSVGNSSLSGYSSSLFNDNFTESLTHAVIGGNSSSMSSNEAQGRSDMNFNNFSSLSQGGQNDFFGEQTSATTSSYASLLGGAPAGYDSNLSSGSTFSYASALTAPSIASAVSSNASTSNMTTSSSGGSPTSSTAAGYQKGYKSKACVFFQSPKGCARGDKCTFAHVSDNVAPSQSPNKGYFQNNKR